MRKRTPMNMIDEVDRVDPLARESVAVSPAAAEQSSGCRWCLVTPAIAAALPETRCAGCLEQRRLRTNAFLEG
jgi:hypothetical protein